ncbi:hypothetical protein DY000_02058976 [Brassica cretica]|uniref:BHLH domain-containing protein n=1 Tax=Brassica cretica TaxID=69181 RepID=A0ABQ7AZN9_BRACR|nr:hypothetical protein DY000_02058976 [Brassica cretica]
MCALGSPLFPNFGWESTGEYESYNIVGDNNSLTFRYRRRMEWVHRQTSLGVAVSSEVNGIDNNSVVIKKLIHNANERNRRKKTNSLFSTLRSCLPGSDEREAMDQLLHGVRTVTFSWEAMDQPKVGVRTVTFWWGNYESAHSMCASQGRA